MDLTCVVMRLFYPVIDSAGFLDAIACVVEVSDTRYKAVRHAVVDALCN